MIQTILNDNRMRPADHTVAMVLLAAIDSRRGDAQLSQPEICRRTGLSRGIVRLSLKRLADAGYFTVIAPSLEQMFDGDHARRYRPQPLE